MDSGQSPERSNQVLNSLTDLNAPKLVGFKVDDSMSIRQAIQNPIQEKLLSEVKREKVNRR
jgi:hypothetical protein